MPPPPSTASFWWHLSKAMLPSRRRFFWTKGNQHNIGGLRQNYCLFDGRHTRNIFSWYDDWLIFFNDPHTQKTRYGSPLLCRGGQQLSFHT